MKGRGWLLAGVVVVVVRPIGGQVSGPVPKNKKNTNLSFGFTNVAVGSDPLYGQTSQMFVSRPQIGNFTNNTLAWCS
jgi:hypothetical protein